MSLEYAQGSASLSFDEVAHAQLAMTAMGLSPISLTQAWTDWAMHVARSPGEHVMVRYAD